VRKLIALSAIAFGAASTANAQSLEEREHTQELVLKHAKDVVRFWKHHPKVYARHWKFASKDAHFHRQQIKWIRRELKETRHFLHAQVQTQTASVYDPAFMCIHKYEGAWDANTGNGYYGGLQMDYGFMTSYGSSLLHSKGTADHWTPSEQIRVAQIARDSGRGYYPWPRTAQLCGLI
jgi:Transglycosylase-like domain